MKKIVLLTPALALAGLLLTPFFTGVALSGEVQNADDDACPPVQAELDKYRYLRALSLDLRGKLPTPEELLALEDLDDVPESLIDQWLASPEFAARTARLHRALLWNNVTNVTLMVASSSFTVTSGLYYRRIPGTMYRGGTVPCNNEPVSYDANGQIKTTVASDGTRREGYVMVNPYWAPTSSIKVCAFDAQETLVSPTGTACSTRDGLDDPLCGCGPNLRWCAYGTSQAAVAEGFAGDIDRRVQDMVANNRSYLDLFSSRTAYVNGPTSYFYKHHTEFFSNVKFTPVSLDVSTLPNLDFTDKETYVPVTLPEGHAGILTSPGFLTRFQTNRARANRFYNAFLCQPFQPPTGGIPSSGDEVPTIDLQQRDGCNYCHTVLEPAGAYWGRWLEQGAGFLNAKDYTPFNSECQRCALTGQGCSDMCRRSYVIKALTEEEDPWLGYFKPYEFRKDEHKDHVEQGPLMLVQLGTQDGRLPECVAKTAAHWLLGRELTPDESTWTDELSYNFVRSGYKYRALVKAIVTSPSYRRVE